MDFAAMFQSWVHVLTKPGEETFVEERQKPQARLATAIIWIIIAAAIAAIFSAISAVISGMMGGGMAGIETLLDQSDLPPEVRQQLGAFLVTTGGGGAFGAFCATIILTPLFFLLGSGIYYVLARVFGGTGTFEEQTYLLATFGAPLTILSSLLSIIPFLGPCLGFFLAIYQLVLTYFALKVAHTMTGGKTIAVILIPVVVVFLCLICTLVVTTFAIVGAAGNGQF